MGHRAKFQLPYVDVAIITIREDEERAVLRRMNGHRPFVGRQIYAVRDVPARDNRHRWRTVATVRCSGEGQSIAQNLARDVIDDLTPETIFVVGIGGGFPSSDFCLGDVTVATRVHDLRVMALFEGGAPEFDVRGGSVEPAVERVVSALQRIDIGRWSSRAAIGLPQPTVKIEPTLFYGPVAWKANLQAILVDRFGPDGTKQRSPKFTAGAFVSTDSLVKEVMAVKRWQGFVRKAVGCEMETAGVFQAARTQERTFPVYGIRGISDVIGFKRERPWTAYACESAAAFAFALIGTGLVPAKRRRRPSAVAARRRNSSSTTVVTPSAISRYHRRPGDTEPPGAQQFRPGLGFIDRGQVESAVAMMLAGAPYGRAEPTTQLSVLAAWQKFGFVDEARRCLELLTEDRNVRRLAPRQLAHCRVIELKLLSQMAEFSRVRDTFERVLADLKRLNMPESRAAVYRRAAVAHAALGIPARARDCVRKARSIDAKLAGAHSRITGEVFAAITLTLGSDEATDVNWALDVLRDAPGVYLSSELDRSVFQAHPLKSAVMCLFSEAAVRLTHIGETPAAWICLTAAHVLGPAGSAHPQAEGYAELLGLLQSRERDWELFRIAMSPESARRQELHRRYSAVNRYLGGCQTLPDLVLGRDSTAWAAMRRHLDHMMAAEMRG